MPPTPYAHKAIAQAIRAVDHVIGERSNLKQQLLFPSCVYGDPEVACVGLTEEEASLAGRKVKIGEFRFIGNGRAGSMGKEEGEVIIVSDSETGEVLGVHMIGPQVTELIVLAPWRCRTALMWPASRTPCFHPGLPSFEAVTHDGEAFTRNDKRDLGREIEGLVLYGLPHSHVACTVVPFTIRFNLETP
jgi:pyruvate/2-oxoglutarate dehydrogenase complex dihydrolipoamide dehydrogenase (E3) component